MADIVIRGMEMPKSGGILCINIFPDGKVTRQLDLSCEQIATAGPLPEEHGRLGDLDALDRAFTDLRFNADGTIAHWDDRRNWCLHGEEIERLIGEAPTIVQAEGELRNDP